MDEDMKQALILAVLGFIIMILASFGVMRIMSVEMACTIVIALGAILVILALVLVNYPRSMDFFRRKDSKRFKAEQAMEQMDDEPKE